MSTYVEESELSRLNRHKGRVPFRVSSELLEVLMAAREAGAATRGAYDITVGPLVDAWGFGPPGKPQTVPEEARLQTLAEYTGWEEIEIDETESTIQKSSGAVRCDLSGIAKGYAVDQTSEALAAEGFDNVMVEVGGEVRTGGTNRFGQPWKIAIERPGEAAGSFHRVLALSDLAMATSGDYRNYYEELGVRYSHIIDPRTAQPIRHRLASVSVVGPFCMEADAFATGLLVLGEEEGFQVALENDLAVLFLSREADGSFAERTTPQFDDWFGRQSTIGAKK